MTKASDVAARMRGSLTPTQPAAAEPPRPAARPTVRRAKPVMERLTVDVDQDLNNVLGDWAQQARRRVGRRVPKTELVRALLELALEDPSIAAQVEERLQ